MSKTLPYQAPELG